MTLETTLFVAEDHFRTEEEQQYLVAEALESGDTAFLVHAIGIVARARGMADIGVKTDLSRHALYAAVGPKGNPTITTVRKVLNSLGLTLELKKAA